MQPRPSPNRDRSVLALLVRSCGGADELFYGMEFSQRLVNCVIKGGESRAKVNDARVFPCSLTSASKERLPSRIHRRGSVALTIELTLTDYLTDFYCFSPPIWRAIRSD